MSYHDTLHYLSQKTPVIELCDQFGGRIAVCPEWNGRIMTSSFDGAGGDSFGCIQVPAIDNSIPEEFGGEDQWTISPLFHPYNVETLTENEAVLQSTVLMSDAEKHGAEVKLSRRIFLLDWLRINDTFGNTISEFLNRDEVSAVGFCSENTVQPCDTASIACRLRGMFNAGNSTAVLLPDTAGLFTGQKNAFDIDYLGNSPHGRFRHLPKLLLMRADGQKRCQVTVSLTESPSVFGALDMRSGMLTLLAYDLPDEIDEHQIRFFNSGHHAGQLPAAANWDEAAYYEANCFSAAQEILPGDSITYCQSILHFNADQNTLSDVIQQVFGVSLQDIIHKMLR